MIKPHPVLGLVAHFPESGSFRVGQEFPFIHAKPEEDSMVNPETNEIAIAWRLLGMADRIGNSAIPEEIANESKAALQQLEECPDNKVVCAATIVAIWLHEFATASDGSDLRELSARALVEATALLREILAEITGKVAA